MHKDDKIKGGLGKTNYDGNTFFNKFQTKKV